ncbi:hypothetical protein DN752_20715 [Echinicola strongylocentroti]|uniref:Lipocalin-like domain-containing protein n=1 Tax=Echinicola strongylocentroti TaxID=1795355 RepID=A0A2Z4INL5_9BACT|nr:hypothetical protein DN752_20715 [Echinicola strongylocentroti]
MSCSEDLGELIVPPSVVGNWKLESLEYDVVTTGMKDGEAFVLNHSGEGKEISLSIDISNDPTNKFVSQGWYLVEVPADFDATTFSDVFPFTDVHKSGTWSKESDKLMYFNFTGIPVVKAEIINFTDKKLVISYDVKVDSAIEGVACINTISGLYTFQKQ